MITLKCHFCNKEVKLKYKNHCDFHFLLGVFFQYERTWLWSTTDSEEEFMSKFKCWLDSLTQQQKESIYHTIQFI